jgi:hypothetical protein
LRKVTPPSLLRRIPPSPRGGFGEAGGEAGETGAEAVTTRSSYIQNTTISAIR